MKCKLCKEKTADKTGSHIVPHFILKNIDNLENSKERDKELGFEISSFGTKAYFGRGILPEKLEEIYGEVTDEIIEKNNVPLLQDYIFCSECEKKLSIIESEYSKNVSTFATQYSIHNPKNLFISYLLWISVIWRLSITSENFKLSRKNESILQRILKNYLRLDIRKIVPLIRDKDLKKVSIKILKSNQNHNPTFKTLIVNPEIEYPYYLVADDYILAFYLQSNKKKRSRKKVPYLKDIQKSINSAKTNTSRKGESITFIDSHALENLNKEFMTIKAKDFLSTFSEILDEIHVKIKGVGKQMPIEIKQEIIETIVSSEEPLGKKYTPNYMSKVIYNVIKKYIA